MNQENSVVNETKTESALPENGGREKKKEWRTKVRVRVVEHVMSWKPGEESFL